MRSQQNFGDQILQHRVNIALQQHALCTFLIKSSLHMFVKLSMLFIPCTCIRIASYMFHDHFCFVFYHIQTANFAFFTQSCSLGDSPKCLSPAHTNEEVPYRTLPANKIQDRRKVIFQCFYLKVNLFISLASDCLFSIFTKTEEKVHFLHDDSPLRWVTVTACWQIKPIRRYVSSPLIKLI